jgi:hypothetical protein
MYEMELVNHSSKQRPHRIVMNSMPFQNHRHEPDFDLLTADSVQTFFLILNGGPRKGMAKWRRRKAAQFVNLECDCHAHKTYRMQRSTPVFDQAPLSRQ